jgi:hypothetical protein
MSAKSLSQLPETFARTRDDLHSLAVSVISPAQRLHNGEIILRATPGGFSTFEFDRHWVGVDGNALVIDGERSPITSLRAAAAAIGIEPDVAQQDQFDVPPHGDLDEPLEVDTDAAIALGAWFAFATATLDEIRADAAEADDASIVRIWPEHFDAAIDMGDQDAGRRGTYGASPGDRHHSRPYLYVSPWAGRIDEFFGDPEFKGASLGYDELIASPDAAAAAVAFLAEARDRINRSTQAGS